jgi:FG-GAP repeat
MITDFAAVPDWFPFQNAGAGLAVGDVDGDGRPDLVVLMVDDPPGQNAGYYRVGWGVDHDGAVAGGWSGWTAVPTGSPGRTRAPGSRSPMSMATAGSTWSCSWSTRPTARTPVISGSAGAWTRRARSPAAGARGRTPGGGWTQLPASPHWPMYAHLFLIADGRVFYSGGQYGDNNGVKPAVWDLGANTAAEVPGLPEAGLRNQSASVLLPPAQDQRVMIVGGGPYDPHNMAAATGSAAIADLAAAAPAYTPCAPLGMPRMHLCATLLPDRTVLVSGGAMMEESAADAALAAEIYHPGQDAWSMAAVARVPRLYHSVALLMRREGGDGRLEPAAQGGGAADRGVLAAVPVRRAAPSCSLAQTEACSSSTPQGCRPRASGCT